MVFAARKGVKRARPFAAWRIVTWLVMLLAAVGFVINVSGLMQIVEGMKTVTPEAAAAMPDARAAMAWATSYIVIAFVVIVMALAALRWRNWGRHGMRVVALVLLVWAAITAWISFGQWQQLGVVLAQPGFPQEAVAVVLKVRGTILASTVLKAVSVPVMAWLAWQLGRPAVRAQFAEPIA
ncbi:hypothetical protein EC912_10834 [Luteibacter rhizovicinus]|uniref:Uncharacterized protein n=1 Tax=Luteibacter rhizovicinus TaxID=242606 RepID=A0A4R3YMI6_9GAMM|nr:hypothetical protein [Luteibacter rhizovicinus]TCV92043.1 hypothetical protein EC912_10834 [Luteibacter rhizovicinus]